MTGLTAETRQNVPKVRLKGLLTSIMLLLCGYGLGSLFSTVAFNHKHSLRVFIQAAMNNGVHTLPLEASMAPLGAPSTATIKAWSATTSLEAASSSAPQQQPAGSASHTDATASDSEVHKPLLLAQHSGDTIISHSELDHVGREGPAACDKGAAKGLQLSVTDALVAPIVIVGHNRVNYLAHCMMSLLKHWTKDPQNKARFPLFVSIDGGDQRALIFAAAWKDVAGVQVITRVHDPAKCTYPPRSGDCHIAAHYKMLLQLFFECLESPRLLFLEEDLEVAPDFLAYFKATAPLLSQDPSLWCISAWNDHGQIGRAVNSTALYRTDILPGLGWMINREPALRLIRIWPELNWDDWMREPHIRQNRQCVFPEVSRTYHYGRVGTHMDGGVFFDRHLANIQLSTEEVDWSVQDLSYLHDSEYESTMNTWLSRATPYNVTKLGDLLTYCDVSKPPDTNATSDFVITYTWNFENPEEYVDLARQLPGVNHLITGRRPRMSYRGVVVTRCRGRRLFLRPSGELLL